jgi:dTMP kinase
MDSRTLALLFAADRADHVSQTIEPALARGQTVVCDRYLLSSLAYQGMELGLGWVESINAGAPPPGVTFFLSIAPRRARARMEARAGASGANAEELFDALKTQERVARAYRRAISHRRSRERIVEIDGELPVEEVTARILRELDPRGTRSAVARPRRSDL